jgi:hypothetical protein
MPWNFLVLPLLAGYVFVTHWNRTKHAAKRKDGRRLLFDAALYGFIFLALAFVFVQFAERMVPALGDAWRAVVPFDYAGTSVLAFLIGVSAWWPLNFFFFPADQEIARAIRQTNDYLEEMLERALVEDEMISLTTSRGKVYIGSVQGNFLPSGERRYVKVLPYVSGYRTSETQEIEITTLYYPVYDKLDAEDEVRLSKVDFGVVIPVSEIHSVRLFDLDAYELFSQGGSRILLA